jgi:DNA mismatch endonuclease (patch repair protein)
MSQIKGAETKPEIQVRKYLFSKGLRYRKNVKTLPGKPDIVLPKYKTIVLVHGCFWHGHKNCKYSALPQTNTEFWKEKIGKNVIRDAKVKKELKKLGWKVIDVWQCKTRKDFIGTMEKVVSKIVSN